MRPPASKSVSRGRNFWVGVGFLVCVSSLLSGPVHAQDIFFQCSAQGNNLNNGEGGWTHEGWGVVISYLEGAQRDMAQDGSGAGPFQHSGVTVVKDLTKSSPLYMDALYQNTTMELCTIKFFRPSSTPGEAENYYMIALTNAKVTFISNQGSQTKILEEITFRAQSITRTAVLADVSTQQNLAPPP